METDFDYERLSPQAFEQLGVALAEAVIGADLEIYGAGPDGGREGTYRGTIDWSATGDEQLRWSGYTIVQVKQCQTLPDNSRNRLGWIKSQIRDEFAKWMDPQSKRTQFPEYLLVITNVPLSAADPGGGIDELRAEIQRWLGERQVPPGEPPSLRSRGLRDVKVWHRDKLNTLVTNNASARSRFAPLMTLGDILVRLKALEARLMGLIPPDHIADILVDHAQTTLSGHRWIQFGDAGDDFNRQSIEKVVFDLKAVDAGGRRRSATEVVLERGDYVLSRSFWKSANRSTQPSPRHIVITGAPGNGKSTLARYLTQVYRAAFAQTHTNEPAVIDLIAATNTSLSRLGLPRPRSPRWPIRVDLAPMAEELGVSGGPNMRRFLCDQITLDSSVPVHLGTLDAWLRMWPTVLFLDGLDEVTHPRLRQRVLTEISALIDKLDALDADALLVLTTRPTGYTPLLPQHFEQLDLDYFTPQEAKAYGRHVTTERLADDPEYRRLALARFDIAVKNPAVDRLLKTPLQVLILTIIAARAGALPNNRYELFWNYYDTIFKREAGKPTTDRHFFARHGSEITALHQRVGIELHRLCEATQELRGQLPLTELKDIARDRMIELGYGIPDANDLAETMARIATHRLVLLAADEDSAVSFDVRSLQELMAGCAMVDVPEADQRRNLTVAACSPHWRNAWLFGAGRLFTGADHQRRLVLEVVEQCDARGKWHGWLYPAGPGLAADILDDGLAADKPKDRRRLIEVALRALDGPMPEDPKALAERLSVATKFDNTSAALTSRHTADRLLVREKLRQAFRTDPRFSRYAIGAVLQHYGAFGNDLPGQPKDSRHFAEKWVYREPYGQRVELGKFLLEALRTYDPTSYPPPELVLRALDECNQLALLRSETGALTPASGSGHFPNLHAALNDPNGEQDLQIIVEAVPPEDWPAISVLARAYWPTASRSPVAGDLWVAGDESPSR